VRRGQGTYVVDGPPLLPLEERRRRLAEAARGYAAVAQTLRLDVAVAVELVAAAMADGSPRRSDGNGDGADE
jgi:hypothetical protein